MAEFIQRHLESAFMPPNTEPRLRSTTRDRRSRRSRHRGRVSPRNYEDAPLPPPPENLHQADGDTFNVDPNMPYLESGGMSTAGQSPDRRRPGGRNFVEEFIIGLRNLVGNNGYGRRRKMDRAVGGMRHPTPTYRARYTWYGISNVEVVDASEPSEDVRSLQPVGSPPTTSETLTAHETYDSHEIDGSHDGETTAVNHEIVPPHISSPELVEPQPGPDYAKMDTPTPSDISIGVYVNRIQKFFQDLNDLPWVADRVTADYIPKRRARPRPTHRPILSWYNSRASQHLSIDLLSGPSSPSTRYLSPPPDMHTSGTTLVYPNANGISTTVPAISHIHGSAEQYPIYPHGYAPYQPVGPPLVSGSGAGMQNVVPMSQDHALPIHASMPMQGPEAAYIASASHYPYPVSQHPMPPP